MIDDWVMMDKKQFLASGLLEQYALGLTSPEETQLVEQFVEHDPEIREKLHALQSAVEHYAAKYAVPPPRRLKRRILSEILADDDEEEEDMPAEELLPRQSVIARTAPPRSFYFSFVGMIMAAVVFIGFLLWRQQQLKANNEALSGQLNNYRMQYNMLQKEETLAESIFNFIERGYADVVHLRGTDIAKDAHAVVYWDAKNKKAHVRLVKMPAVPSGKQFQIWAEVNGAMVNLGLLDNARTNLQMIKYLPDAHSLNITIESLGGSETPSVLLLVANGEL
jgi:anti-sigma-K factor RskA